MPIGHFVFDPAKPHKLKQVISIDGKLSSSFAYIRPGARFGGNDAQWAEWKQDLLDLLNRRDQREE